MAEKKFLAYTDNLVPISTKLDTVIEDTTTLKTTTGTIDTTTKDTNSKVSAMQTKVDGIDSNVAGIAAIQSAIASLSTTLDQISNKIDDISSGGSGGITSCIRHIQRGTSNISSTERIVDVSLRGFSDVDKMGFSDVDKMFAIVNASSVDATGEVMGVTVSGLTATKLSVAATSRPDDVVDFSYQVIELY